MKKIAMVLSGCGHKDGAEITEAVSAIVELSRLGFDLHFFAPDIDFKVKDPISAKLTNENRNVMHEAARITRGHISDLKKLNAAEYSALVFPGGTGVAYNFCNWAERGANCQVNESVEKAIVDFYEHKKPIGAICIAPVLLAKTLGKKAHGVSITIGNDLETAQEIAKTGAKNSVCKVTEACVDKTHLLVTTPAYMYSNAKPYEVYDGIKKWAQELAALL